MNLVAYKNLGLASVASLLFQLFGFKTLKPYLYLYLLFRSVFKKIAMASLSKCPSSSSDEDGELRRGPWTLEEDTLLIHYISSHGEGRWNLLAKHSG